MNVFQTVLFCKIWGGRLRTDLRGEKFKVEVIDRVLRGPDVGLFQRNVANILS